MTEGTPAYNKSLGDRRASSVKQYLVDLGSDSNRIEFYPWVTNLLLQMQIRPPQPWKESSFCLLGGSD